MDVLINGISVIFPYKPYDIQIDYMRSVITALQNKQNALLESPTGTGKTLSLLCSSLAWLDYKKFAEIDQIPDLKDRPVMLDENKSSKSKGKGWKNENPIRIIYSSRTHSQLNQACSELKNSYYKFCPTITIGSRDQLCINPEVKKLETISAKNQACRYQVKNNLCKFHHNYERKVSDLSCSGSRVYDIEDLVKFGNEHKACPYYMAKAKSDFNTSLIFMPYNYVLDPSIRRTLKLNLENTVIIFDEGHNIERVCEDSMSTELKSEWLALFISTFDSTLQALKLLDEGKYDGINEKELGELNIHEVAKIKLTICNLEMEVDQLVKKNQSSTKSYHPTEEIFHIMERVGLDYEKCNLICSVCEKIVTYVMNSTTSFMTNSVIGALTAVCSFLEIVIPFSQAKDVELPRYKNEFVKNYKLYSEIENENNYKNSWAKKKSQNSWTLYLWCMSPSVAIKSLKNLGVYNLIITSGTLSPLESFECEMGIPFHVKLQNSHVISKNQLSIQLIFKDPSGHELSGSYENRNDIKYYNGLGFTILELSRVIPKGMFIFFSSYSLINKCIEMWKERKGVNLWNSISNAKKIFVEPRNKNEFSDSIQAFKETIDNSREGAIFMGVSRGKLSEGIDLGDDYCRAVIIIGLPYPARYDPKVVLKQKYLDENNAKINGIKWYMLQMKRALNQSIGRVVRHKNDYGTIIICDSRFKQLQDGLSKWIHAFLSRNPNFNGEFRNKLSEIKHFFNQNEMPLNALDVEKKQSTSGGDKVTQQKTNSPKNTVQSTVNDSLITNMFDSMKQEFTKIKQIPYKTPTKKSDSNSIFDSFDCDPLSTTYENYNPGKRNYESSMKISDSCTKKSKLLFKKVPYFEEATEQDNLENSCSKDLKISPNNKAKQMSKYFNRSKLSEIQDDNTGKDNEIIEIDSEDDTKTAEDKIKDEKIDFESEDIKSFSGTLLKTADNMKAFEIVVQEISTSSFKYRQFIETLKIYSKKRNATYLALRMNFILENVQTSKRNSILKDFSSIVPERERKHFLMTCKVNPS